MNSPNRPQQNLNTLYKKVEAIKKRNRQHEKKRSRCNASPTTIIVQPLPVSHTFGGLQFDLEMDTAETMTDD